MPNGGDSVCQAEALAADADEETLRYFEGQVESAVVAHNRGAVRDRIEANLGLTSGLVADRETVEDGAAVAGRLDEFDAHARHASKDKAAALRPRSRRGIAQEVARDLAADHAFIERTPIAL